MIEKLRSNLDDVRKRIETAAVRSGRQGKDITLVGVTKYVDADVTRAFVEAGCTTLGENRPQQLWDKAERLSDLNLQWHMIGHLQRNKVKRTLESACLIHSADSLRLLNAINSAAESLSVVANVLLEVNVSGEEAKHGFDGAADSGTLEAAVEHVETLGSVRVQGLMAMAGLAGDLDDARREFVMLRNIRDRLAQQDLPENVQTQELSMGMSGDFEVAIEEGATIVRVGSALFAGVM